MAEYRDLTRDERAGAHMAVYIVIALGFAGSFLAGGWLGFVIGATNG